LTKMKAGKNHLEDIVKNYKSVTRPSERFKLLLQSSVGALKDPERADLVSMCGDLSSTEALKRIEKRM